jgi:hypothetical protein
MSPWWIFSSTLLIGATVPAMAALAQVIQNNLQKYSVKGGAIATRNRTRRFGGIVPPLTVLPTMTAISVGGVPAAVQFSGLIYPGEWQLNVVVPQVSAGEQPITLGYAGLFGHRASIAQQKRQIQNEAKLRPTNGAHRVYVS